MFVAASERADEHQARLRAERQAEYNRYLEEKKAHDIHPRVQPKPQLPVPPNLKGYEDQYFKESSSPEKFGPAANNPLSEKELKIQKQREYAAELKRQAEMAAQRKREERERDRALSRERMQQLGSFDDVGGMPFPAGGQGYGPPPGYEFSPQGPPAGAPPQGFHGYAPEPGYGAPPPPPHFDGGYAGQPSPGAAAAAQAPALRSEPSWRDGGGGGGRGPVWPDQEAAYAANNAGGPRRPRPPPQLYVPEQAAYPAVAGGPYGGGEPQLGPSPSFQGLRRQPSNAGAMVFGEAKGGATRRSAEQLRKAAYRAELEQQMAAVAERKAAQKRREQEEDAKFEQQAAEAGFQVWGGGRGGGGAPLRDDAGNVLSDLNRVRQYHKEGGPGNHYHNQQQLKQQQQQQQHGQEVQQMQPGNPQGGPAPEAQMQPEPTQGRQEIVGNFRSDNAYMLPQELEARARAKKQMQDDLQAQIEAKKRAKEEEKRREKEEERKEMERLAREQDELKAAFESEGKHKKAEAMKEAEKLRALAEEAYIEAQAKKVRKSDTGEGPHQHQGILPQASGHQPPLPPMPPSRGRTQEPQDRFYRDADPEPDFFTQHLQREPQHTQRRPGSRDAARPRTAAELARLKQEMALQNEQMKLQVQKQMREAAERQEHELQELRLRAEAAEQEVAEIKKEMRRVPSFGRRASQEGSFAIPAPSTAGRRRWEDSADYAPESARSDPGQDSIDFDASLHGDSRLIFPAQDSQRPRSGPRASEMSISSMRPIPMDAAASQQGHRPVSGNGGPARSLSAARPPRSRLGTPLDPTSILAKNENRAKYLDELEARRHDSADPEEIKANSDSLDDLLLKFVELEANGAGADEARPPSEAGRGISAIPAHLRPASSDLSLRGDSEWIVR